ncbi:hypothetical protein QZH41_003173 [Actinostola sp. cb2023]|nr:hypothetical protein QZH41_003173 [Actinostola sp. cb2023]
MRISVVVVVLFGSKMTSMRRINRRFQPLQDSRQFFLDEVYAEEHDTGEHDNLPMTVRFVESSSICMQGTNMVSLNELGNDS